MVLFKDFYDAPLAHFMHMAAIDGPHGIEIAVGGPTVLKSLVGAPTVLFKDFYDAPLAHFMHMLAYGCAPRC